MPALPLKKVEGARDGFVPAKSGFRLGKQADMPQSSRPGVTPRRATSTELADRRDKTVREQLEKERAASAAKTAKLRALRLAKEAAENETEPKAASGEPPARKKIFRF